MESELQPDLLQPLFHLFNACVGYTLKSVLVKNNPNFCDTELFELLVPPLNYVKECQF